MKLPKTFFVLVILFVSTQVKFGQEQPKAELYDEWGNVTWEEVAARIDNLLTSLTKKPNSAAYIVIHNDKNLDYSDYKLRQRFRYERWVKGQIKLRQSNEKRIFVIRGEDKDESQIQIWLTPEGAEKPSFTEAKWNTTLPSNAKPYIFTKTEWDDGLAPPVEYLSLNLFSEYLKSNLTARGHFVIRVNSKSEFRKEQKTITNLLIDKYKILPKRLRFFYVRENKPRLDYPQVEVWLVPQKKK